MSRKRSIRSIGRRGAANSLFSTSISARAPTPLPNATSSRKSARTGGRSARSAVPPPGCSSTSTPRNSVRRTGWPWARSRPSWSRSSARKRRNGREAKRRDVIVNRRAAPQTGDLIEYIRANRERYLGELKTWIACPSVSADPARHDEVRRSAEAVVARMRAAGLTEAAVLETAGLPVAYGSWLHAPGAPTVLIYGHHDVQPEDPLALWESPPFEATVRDGKLFGRGAVDDKGQVLMHLAAIEAHLNVNGKLPLNVKVVVEGEEEIGSPSFEPFLAAQRDRLACDVVVVSDTAVFAEDVPSLTVSLRGLVHWEVTMHGPSSDLHSGYFGGLVVNPLEALAHVIASLREPNGRIAVDGFYDGVREPGAAQRAELAALPFDVAAEARALGVTELAGGE